jgi:hypothetical protein
VGATRQVRRSGAGALTVALLALVAAGCGSSSSSGSSSSNSLGSDTSASTSASIQSASQPGPEGIPLEQGPELAPASSTSPGNTVDGIQCAPLEQLAYHIHAHLQVYVKGQPRALPGAIGLLGPVAQQSQYGPFYGAQQCYYWLHTHASDGVIHIESPTQRIYTLGNFFHVWRQPLSASQVASASGPVTAFINGKRWTASPTSIPVQPHAVVQLDVGSPVVPFQPISFAGTQL